MATRGGTYTGAWLRNAYVDPAAAYVPTADPEHADTTATDERLTVAYGAPPLTDTGEGAGEYFGQEWVVTGTPGTQLDYTDYESHQADTHAGGQGAELAANYSPHAPTQFAGERYESVSFTGLPGQAVNDTAIRRGQNSDPVNQPDGFPLGERQVNDFHVDRRLYVGERVHDRRVVTPNLPAEITNVPAQTGQGSAPWINPFATLARPMNTVNQRPQMRRPPIAPNAATDDLQSDPDPYMASPVIGSGWVVG